MKCCMNIGCCLSCLANVHVLLLFTEQSAGNCFVLVSFRAFLVLFASCHRLAQSLATSLATSKHLLMRDRQIAGFNVVGYKEKRTHLDTLLHAFGSFSQLTTCFVDRFLDKPPQSTRNKQPENKVKTGRSKKKNSLNKKHAETMRQSGLKVIGSKCLW